MAESDLLRLVHWLSPVFPVGGYAYSGGLETAIADGSVTSEETLFRWLEMLLLSGSARTDAILLTSAMRPDADVEMLGFWAQALASSAERWQETSEQGAAFARALEAVGQGDGRPRVLPVAVGVAARSLDIAPSRVAALYLQSLVANIATGAVRHVPLGQAAGTRVISGLADRILSVSKEVVGMRPETAFSGAFAAEMAQMRHEIQETRIFRT